MHRARWPSRVLAAALVVSALGCVSSFEKAQEKVKDDPEFLYEGALQALAAGRLAVARERIERAVAVKPESAKLHNTSALVAIFERDYARALSSADAAILIEPNLSDAHNNRGLALLNLGRSVEAESEFRIVLADEDFPRRTNLDFNLGVALLRQGKATEALEALYRVQQRSPAQPGLGRHLGEARELLGEWDKAAANYLEAFKKDDKDAELALRLGRCFDRLGQNELALRYWRRAVALAPEAPEVDEARRAVAAADHHHSE